MSTLFSKLRKRNRKLPSNKNYPRNSQINRMSKMLNNSLVNWWVNMVWVKIPKERWFLKKVTPANQRKVWLQALTANLGLTVCLVRPLTKIKRINQPSNKKWIGQEAESLGVLWPRKKSLLRNWMQSKCRAQPSRESFKLKINLRVEIPLKRRWFHLNHKLSCQLGILNL